MQCGNWAAAQTIPYDRHSASGAGADGAGRRVFSLTWTESGGPPVEPPSHKGLGSTLLERVLTTQCRADVEVTFDPAGLRVRLSAPLVEERLVPHY